MSSIENQSMCRLFDGKPIGWSLDTVKLPCLNILAFFHFQASKANVTEVQNLACRCFRLNSFQMTALLSQEKIPKNLVDTAIRMAESVADELARGDGREVTIIDAHRRRSHCSVLRLFQRFHWKSQQSYR